MNTNLLSVAAKLASLVGLAIAAVPEATSAALFSLGPALLAFTLRRRVGTADAVPGLWRGALLDQSLLWRPAAPVGRAQLVFD